MAASPTSRSLVQARRNGWTAGVVEKWIPQTKRRLDLFGWIDIVALDGHPGCLAIQATSTSNLASRIEKAKLLDSTRDWLEAGNRAEFWGWAKRGKVGRRKLWALRRVDMRLEGEALTTEVIEARAPAELELF